MNSLQVSNWIFHSIHEFSGHDVQRVYVGISNRCETTRCKKTMMRKAINMNKNKDEALSGIASIFGTILGFTGIIALMIYLNDPAIQGILYPASPTPTVTAMARQIVTPPAANPLPAAHQTERLVCTGIVDGHLHVRASAGHQSPIRGVLTESTVVTHTGSSDGGWIEISLPLAGWVNSQFLCEVSSNRSVSP